MWWIEWIITNVEVARSVFWNFYLEVNDWPWPFHLVSKYLWDLASFCVRIITGLEAFNEWADDVAETVGNYLNWDAIWSYIISVIPNLEQIRDWFYNWYWNIYDVISTWWFDASSIIQAWIDIAKQFLQDQIDTVNSWIEVLRSTWDNFVSVTLPTLATWVDVNNLIDSTLRLWFPFYDDLVALWNDIVDFFSDPLQWAYNKLDEWFERFW